MPSATIAVDEALPDFSGRIEAALVEHSGTITLSGNGVMPASETDIEDVSDITIESGVTVRRVTQDPDDALEASSERAVLRFASGGSGSITGGTIDADGGSYSAIAGLTGSGAVELTNVNAINATFKQINLNGSGAITNCTVSSSVQGVPGSVPRPTAFQSDLESGVADYLDVDGLTIGMFYGSREGQMVKIARVTNTDLNRITTPVIDSDTWYSLVMGEELDYVKIRNCKFPRKITHFADGTGGADTLVRLLVIADTTIGNEDEAILYLHDGETGSGLLARTVIYLNVNFVNAGTTCIIDDTPAADLATRVFIGCKFDTATESTLISHRDGAGILTGKIKWANCTFIARDSGSWSKPSDWAASEVTLPAGYSLENLVELFA